LLPGRESARIDGRHLAIGTVRSLKGARRMEERAGAGSADVDASGPVGPVAADRKLLTFLIADIRGYSTFTRERGDAAAAILAQSFADLARDAVEARSGRVVELRGDEAFAVFESTAQAVRAAIDVQATFAEQSRSDPEFPLPVGVGIDVGDAVPVEGGYRGVAVNMAARLCSSAAAGQVLVTRTVVDLVHALEDVMFADRGLATFKGFEEPVEVIEALGVATRAAELPDETGEPSDRAVPPELTPITPLVDREREMRWLRGTWRQVRRGHGRILLVSGPAQIGKTRLAAELASFVHADGADVRYSGPGGTGTALAMSAIRGVTLARHPVLLILDDIDVAGPAPSQALGELCDEIAGRSVLVLGLLRDRAASTELALLVDRVDERGDGHRVLGPFGLDEVRGIVRLYLGEAEHEAPVESFKRASEGVPGRVHEVVSNWTRSEASRRLSAAAEFLATGRERHASDLEFANNAIAVKLGRLFMVGGRDVLAIETCPYKGLSQFDAADSALFFGRERLVGELAARTVGTGVLGVAGASGSGKSSAIAAGLLPSLEAGLLPGSERWRHVMMRPGAHPMKELRRALGSNEEQPLEASVATVPKDGRLVLVIDQFEEVFTLCSDEPERAAFIDALTGPALASPDRVVVVPAIRGDHFAHAAIYREFAGGLAANTILVGPLTRDELRRAIELPARRAGLRIESALVDALVEKVADEPGSLPLLSTALVELWQAREAGWIRMRAYEHTGGVEGAVARLAEASYFQLSKGERAAARRVLLRLVVTDESEAISKRRVPLEDFDLDQDETAEHVIARLTQDRLLTVGDGCVEVSHEALLREWPRLRGWLDEDVQGRQLHRHLTDAAREWSASGEDQADLYRGARLGSALDFTAQHTIDLNDRERRFLERSREATQAEVQRTRRSNRRLRVALVGVALFLIVSLVGGSLAVQQRTRASDAARVADSKRLAAQAIAQQDLGQSVRLALAGLSLDDSTDTRGALLQVLQRDPAAIGLIDVVGGISDVAISPDGKTLVTDPTDSLEFVDSTTGTPLGDPVHPPKLTEGWNVSFDPLGRMVALDGRGTGNNLVSVVDVASHRVTTQTSFSSTITPMGMSFAPDGSRIAVATADWGRASTPSQVSPRWIEFIDPETGRQARPLRVGTFDFHVELGTSGSGHFTSMAYLPNGRLAVSYFDGGTTIWDLTTRRPVRRFNVGGPALAASPDGSMLAVGRQDGGVATIDLRNGRVRPMDNRHAGDVTRIVFSPDGKTVITSAPDNQFKVWDVQRSELTESFPAPTGNMAVSPDGQTLYTAGGSSEIAVWDLGRDRGLTASSGIGASYPAFRVDQAGDLVAYSKGDGSIGLWDPLSGSTLRGLPPVGGQGCSPAALSRDGSLVVEGCNGGLQHSPRTFALWDDRSRKEIGHPMRASGGAVWAADFAPDGKTVAIVSDDYFPKGDEEYHSTLTIWDVATMRPLFRDPIRFSAPPDGVAFSPDGRLLAVSTIGNTRGAVGVWDVRTGGLVAQPDAPRVWSMAFSPDGRTLALASASINGSVTFWNTSTWQQSAAPIVIPADSISYAPDGKEFAIYSPGELSLWDVASGERLGGTYAGPPSKPYGLAKFLPDGRVLLMTQDEPVFLYRTTETSWKAQACSIVDDVTMEQWQAMVPSQPYRPVCG
jgi:WD40 repeat protein/class 3 adenylate cyclase